MQKRPSVERVGPLQENGFSLIEMLVALALFTLSIAVMLPVFGTPRSGARLSPLIMRLAVDLKSARTKAIVSNRPVSVILDPINHSYRIDGDRTSMLPASVRLKLTPDMDRVGEDDSETITFFPDGSSTGGSVILSAQTSSMTLSVGWLTGAMVARGSPR